MHARPHPRLSRAVKVNAMQAGQQIRQYVLEERIGAGGMGEVWRARQPRLRRTVAVKIIREHGAQDASFRERFDREAQAMALLEHPHIVRVHDFFTSDGHGFLVMGFVDGCSLETRGRLPFEAAIQIAREILDALNFAHQQGVIHRDVKPSNILLDRRGHAYMMDFGIALVAGTERITRLTRSGTAVGTPEYMSPEQITTPEDIDHRTDVYSFGCVLYEMLSGQPPFGSRDQGTTEFELMQAHVTRRPVPLRRLNPHIDRHTDAVVMRALAKDRDDRFAGCGDMAQALFYKESSTAEPLTRMKLRQLLFSLQGRLNRAQYWKGFLLIAGFYVLVSLALAAAFDRGDQDLADLLLIVSLAGVWPGLAIAIKRWHDRDRRLWWFLTCLLVIPIPWLVVQLWFMKGTVGANRYGVEPR
jgi:eukaryotic-like serine/threonine-protein kinase